MQNQFVMRVAAFFVILVSAFWGSLASAQASSRWADPIRTSSGWVRGVLSDKSVVFKGIPYAAPPVGPLRFKAPKPHPKWKNVFHAARFGSPCLQIQNRQMIGSEDCLTLNIWVPTNSRSRSLPVVVFLHGDTYFSGSSSHNIDGVDVYDGQTMAENGPTIVITLNYRLGALGFLAHPTLERENRRPISGNYGLLDQIRALRWIRTNIANFGGDTSRVLLLGHATGANAACAIMTSPKAKGLFSRVALLSGTCQAHNKFSTLEASRKVIEKLGCDLNFPLICLRQKRAEEFLSALHGTPYHLLGPHVDGFIIPEYPWQRVERGAYNAVPLILGHMEHEASTLVERLGFTRPKDESDYRRLLQQKFPSLYEKLLTEYPVATYESAEWALVDLLTDYYYRCPIQKIAQAVANRNEAPVWHYTFSQNFGVWLNRKAAQGLEIPYVFNSLRIDGYTPTEVEMGISNLMINFINGFAANANPNGRWVDWPRLTSETKNSFRIDPLFQSRPFKNCVF